jgi:hypothetical protein
MLLIVRVMIYGHDRGIFVAAASHIRVTVLPIDSPYSLEVFCFRVSSSPVSDIFCRLLAGQGYI